MKCFIQRSRVLLLLLALPAFSAFCQSQQTAPAIPRSCIPSAQNFYAHAAWNKECEDRVAAIKGKPCDIIFIGDSITQNFVETPKNGWNLVGREVWDRHYGNRNALDFGVGADRTENVLWRLDHMEVKELRPKVAVVLIGTNNTDDTPMNIAAGVHAVIDKTQQIFPGVKVIVISILPNRRATQKMADANTIISTFGDNRSLFYFDLASKMTPVGDNWKGVGFDHLHLTQQGYETWASEMEPLLSSLLPFSLRGASTPSAL
jgi:lysophospholipase L1-like esterase